MMAVWGDEETLKLIQLWGEDSIQAQLEGCKWNAQVFAKIASELREAGYERTVLQCREKIKKLRADYRKIRDSHNKKGTGRKKWKFFDAIDVVIGHKPATCPPLVVDSSAHVLDPNADQEVENASESGNMSDAETAPLAETVREKSRRSSTPLPPSTSGDRSTGDETSTSLASTSSCTASTPLPPSKKRKLSKIDKVEGAVKDIVDSLIVTFQKEDDKIAKIEERRIDLEEKMAERDSKYRTDMLEFQKQMFSTLAGMMQQSRQMPGPSGLGHQPPPFPLSQPNPASSAYIPSTTSIYNMDYYQGSESEEDQY